MRYAGGKITQNYGDNKIAGVTIKKQRAGAADPRVMGKTDSLGTVTFASSAVWRQSNNMFTFTIDGMLKNGYVYEPDAASKSRHFTVKPHWLLNILSHLDAPLAAGRT